MSTAIKIPVPCPVPAPGTRTSRRQSQCPLCPTIIFPGDSVVPTSRSGHPSAIDWVHAACCGPDVNARPPCRHWRRLGRCPLLEAGESCAFGHPPDARGESADAGRKWGGRRRRVRNGHRNSVFRAFLHKTYGSEFLTSGAVLDVAAGKGALGWELVNLSGVEAVAVEPRRIDVKQCSRKWRAGHYEPSRLGKVFSKCNLAAEEGCSERNDILPAQIRCFFEAEGFGRMIDAETAEEKEEANEWFDAQRRKAREFRWTTRGLQNHHGYKDESEDENDTKDEEEGDEKAELPNTAFPAITENEIESATAARRILRKTILVVGMHPDQAAGEIAAFAHSRGIPWCAVPCCVYSDEFPKRRLADGTRVTTHDHLVRWLCETYPGAQTAVLDDVGGKNVIVYTLPSQSPLP